MPTTTVVNGIRFVTAPIAIGQSLNWVVPELTGNLLGIYGTPLKFSLFYELDANPVNPQPQGLNVIMKVSTED